MDLPKRTKQQQSEAHSYAVLLYKLRDLGIFRNLTSNDYGIDFELEMVDGDQVSGQTVKIQVKSAEALKSRADTTAAVGGIKQSTLNYWCELSYRTNVIAYAVDLSSETIYVSNNLFWQATQAIDGGEASKSISFHAPGDNSDATAKTNTLMWTNAPTAADQVYAHTLALRRLKPFLELLGDVYHYDAGTPLDRTYFQDLLEASRILMWRHGSDLWTDARDREHWANSHYWQRKAENMGFGELSCLAAQPILSTLTPALIRTLRHYKNEVLTGKYYWAHRNPEFLRLVYETPLPEEDDYRALIDWGEQYEVNHRQYDYFTGRFIRDAREPKPAKVKKSRRKQQDQT